MKSNSVPVWTAGLMAALVSIPLPRLLGAEREYARDGSGVYGYRDTPKLPWCEWRVHDPDRPAPPRVNPGPAGPPAPVPSDAIVLFDGKDLDAWEPADWKIEDGLLVSGDAHLASKEQFGDMQLHVEWMPPANFEGSWANQGNNGVLLMGLYEIQIFDSYNEKIYPDGQCGAIYGQTPPLVNACRPPGQWQSFDIFFKAPVFSDGALVAPARVTVIHNGLLIQWNEEIHGQTGHRILPAYQRHVSAGPVTLYGHHCPVKFRNLWARHL